MTTDEFQKLFKGIKTREDLQVYVRALVETEIEDEKEHKLECGALSYVKSQLESGYLNMVGEGDLLGMLWGVQLGIDITHDTPKESALHLLRHCKDVIAGKIVEYEQKPKN